MAQNLGAIVAALELNTKGFDSGIKMAGNSTKKLDDNLNKGMNKAHGAIEKVKGSIFNVKTLLLSVATSAAIKKGFDWTIAANANMEQYQSTLETVLKSEEKAIDMLAWAEQFAAKTPFEIDGLVGATVKLEAYGLKAKEVLPGIGNMAAVMGKDLIQAVEAVADAQTGELERLKEFSITKNMIIQQATEMGIQGIVNAKGQITDMAQFNIALMALMEEKFSGGMERQSKDYKGMLSNLSDYFSRFGRKAGEEAFDLLKSKLGGLLDKLDELAQNGTFDRWAKNVGGVVATTIEWLSKLGEAIGWVIEKSEILIPTIWGLVTAFTALKVISIVSAMIPAITAGLLALESMMTVLGTKTYLTTAAVWGFNSALIANPIGLIIVGIGALVAAIIALKRNWDTVSYHLANAWESIKLIGLKVFEALKVGVLMMVKKQIEAFQKLLGWIPGLEEKLDQAKEAIDNLIDHSKQKVQTAIIETENKKRALSYERTAKEIEKSLERIGTVSNEGHKQIKNQIFEEKLLRKGLANDIEETSNLVTKTTNNMKSNSKSLMDTISDHLSKISSRVQNSIGIVEKKLELWSLKNNVAKESSEYLTHQIEIQKEKHELLNQTIQATEDSLAKVIAKYGESSSEAIKLQNDLLGLRIEQEELKDSIEQTTSELEKQIDAYTRLEEYLKKRAVDSSSQDIVSYYKAQYYNKQYAEGALYHEGGTVKKYHDGGPIDKITSFFGNLRNDEVPAILQTGEFVLSRDMVKSINNNQGIDYDKLGKSLAKHIKPSVRMYNNFNSPEPLSPSKIKQNQEVMLRQMAMEWG